MAESSSAMSIMDRCMIIKRRVQENLMKQKQREIELDSQEASSNMNLSTSSRARNNLSQTWLKVIQRLSTPNKTDVKEKAQDTAQNTSLSVKEGNDVHAKDPKSDASMLQSTNLGKKFYTQRLLFVAWLCHRSLNNSEMSLFVDIVAFYW